MVERMTFLYLNLLLSNVHSILDCKLFQQQRQQPSSIHLHTHLYYPQSLSFFSIQLHPFSIVTLSTSFTQLPDYHQLATKCVIYNANMRSIGFVHKTKDTSLNIQDAVTLNLYHEHTVHQKHRPLPLK